MNKLILGTPKGSRHPVYIRVNDKGFFELGCDDNELNGSEVTVNMLDQSAFKNGRIRHLTDCDLDRIDDLICEAGSLAEKIMIDKEPPVFAVSKTQHAMRIAALKAVVDITWREIRKITSNPGASCRDCTKKECAWRQK